MAVPFYGYIRLVRFWRTCLFAVVAAAISAAQPTALDRYVAEPDPSYSFRLAGSYPGLLYTTHVLEMTSQTWRSAAEVDRPVWRHWLLVVVPFQVRTSTALLLVNGGANDGPQPAQVDLALGPAAAAAGAVFAELRTVPNQPLKFLNETRTRSEDAIIACTWDKFLRTGDENWPAHGGCGCDCQVGGLTCRPDHLRCGQPGSATRRPGRSR